MVPVDVTFADDLPIAERERAAITAVLHRIPTDGDGSWPDGISHIRLTRLLTGGLGGASVVAQLVVSRGSQHLIRVVKCGSADEMTREWQAYHRYVREFSNVLCARIEAASRGVSDRGQTATGELECVIYDHVAQHAGGPDHEAVPLQDVARAAYRGDAAALDAVTRLVATLFRRAYEVFYNRTQPELAGSLRELNGSLGPDIVVEIDGFDDDGSPCHGKPTTEDRRAALRYPEELRGGAIEDGTLIAVNDLRLTVVGDHLIGSRDDLSVEIRAVPGSATGAGWPALAGRTAAVYGRVVDVRSRARRRSLATRFDEFEQVGDTVVADGVVTADPFAALPLALTDPAYGRIRAVAHGDMNVRNILIVTGEPYLIDYARTRPGLPLLTDFAWLEVGLLRDAFAAGGYPNLVRLQRMLAFASRLMDTSEDVGQIVATVVRLIPGEPDQAAFRILLAVRWQARECARRAGEPNWWPCHVAQLVLAAHRTFKWTGPEQDDDALRASMAVAAVAAEWLPGTTPFSHWPTDQLADTFQGAGPLLADGIGDTAVDLVRLMVTELDGRGVRDGYEPQVDRLRTALVRRRYADDAARIVAGAGADHDRFLDLTATPVHWPDGAGRPQPAGVPVDALALATEAAELLLLGDAGAGKTAVVAELRYRSARARLRGDGSAGADRVPVAVHAGDVADHLPGDPVPLLRTIAGDAPPTDLIVVGAVHLIVDGMDELPDPDRIAVANWLVAARGELPRLRVLVCQRLQGYDPLLLPFPTVVLDPLDPAEVQDHVLRLVAMNELAPDAARAILEFRWDDADGRRPGDLRMLTELARTGTVPGTVAELREGAILLALGQSGVTADDAFAALERLAEHSIDDPDSVDTVPRSVIDPLASTGLLRTAGRRVWFTRTADRDYFAARALLSHGGDTLVARAVRAGWHAAYRTLVALPDVPDEVVTHLVDGLLPVAPVLAGRTLRDARTRPPAVVRRFLAVQRDELVEPGGRTAARALAEYGAPEATEVLRAVAANPDASTEARINAFEALAEMSQADPELLGSALTGSNDAVRACAASVVGRTRTAGLELMLAELIDPAQPWSACAAAATALRALDVVRTPQVTSRYHEACRTRLRELEAELPRLTTNRDVRDVQRERVGILAELAEAGHLDVLLERRFDFEIGDAVRALLADRSALPDENDPELDGTDLDLRRLAATVQDLDPARLTEVEELFLVELGRVSGDRIEGLAALLSATYRADHLRGIRMAWQAARVLTERQLPQRLRWPWQRALSLSGGSMADLDELLCGGGAGADLAVTALAAADFHRDGSPGPTHRFSAAAREQLLARQPEDAGTDALRWALAAATVSLSEALPALLRFAENTDLGHRADAVTSNRYGPMDYAPLADLLTAIGWLARTSEPTGDASAFLHDLDTRDLHPSVATARLVALAYSGAALPLLAAAGTGNPITDTAASNTVRLWLPGHRSPIELGTPRHVADWLATRLLDPTTPRSARVAMLELLAEAEA